MKIIQIRKLTGAYFSKYNIYKDNNITLLDTLAAPVLLGMMLQEAALPPLQSFIDGPSTVF